MGCQAENCATFLRSVFKLSNIRGALVTMPHKVSTTGVVGISLFDVNANTADTADTLPRAAYANG